MTDDHEPRPTDADRGRWRPMRAADIPMVGAVSDAVHGAAFTEPPAIYAERLALYPSGCFVFERHGTIMGYLIAHPWHRDHPPALGRTLGAILADADAFCLHDLALLPGTRGIGAGRAAVALAVEAAVTAGFTEIMLTAVNGADAFWSAQGFTAADAGDRASPYGPGTLLMRRALAA